MSLPRLRLLLVLSLSVALGLVAVAAPASYSGNPGPRVTTVERKTGNDWLIGLDGPMPRFEPKAVLDNLTWSPNITARNNRVSMNPVHGFLFGTRGKIVVDGNAF